MTKTAIYAGSFDPITNGHLDIINRGLDVFDKIHVGVLENTEKDSFFTISERVDMIANSIHSDRIEVEGFSGLLVDFAKQKNVSTVIRGLRAVSDFEYEFQMSLTNRALNQNIDTVFFMTDQKYSYLSSSLIKQLAKFNGDISEFVPSSVTVKLKEKFSNE